MKECAITGAPSLAEQQGRPWLCQEPREAGGWWHPCTVPEEPHTLPHSSAASSHSLHRDLQALVKAAISPFSLCSPGNEDLTRVSRQ